ncbi:MAG: hypothetical protein HOY78_02095 [Saccharothrix sp.]|nr:hypothetical protein [Saccharothrix sp.]
MNARTRNTAVKTKSVQCAHTRKGRRVGGNVVAWTAPCKARVRVPADWSDYGQKCNHHRSRAENDRLRAALAGRPSAH